MKTAEIRMKIKFKAKKTKSIVRTRRQIINSLVQFIHLPLARLINSVFEVLHKSLADFAEFNELLGR